MTGAELFASEFAIPFVEFNAAWKALSKDEKVVFKQRVESVRMSLFFFV